MGVNMRDIASPKKIELSDLHGRKVAIDAFNTLYQFLSIIRGETGDLLKDSRGNVTSHLSGLFYRNINLIESGMKLVYVFDGESPKLKHAEVQRRKEVKVVAAQKYQDALEREDFANAKRFASATAHLDQGMISDSKKLLDFMGIPWVQAPSEGEATAAHLTTTGVVDYAGSQDYDSLLFGAKRLARNITISGKRRLPGKNFRIDVVPETIILEEVLQSNGISREQLIEVAMILGTDFNYADFKGIGPKTALKLVKRYDKVEDIPELKGNINFDPDEVRNIFLHPLVADVPGEATEQKPPNEEEILRFLVSEHDFSEERIKSSLARISKKKEEESQSLEQWFGN